MSRLVGIVVLLAGAATTACGSDKGVEPQPVPAVPAPVVLEVGLWPATALLPDGRSLRVVPYNPRGGPLPRGVVITYRSSDSTAASVDGSGRVMGNSPGDATISATAGLGTAATTATMQVSVRPIPLTGQAILTYASGAWAPAVVRVPANSIVTWVAPPNSWASNGKPVVRLFDVEWGFPEETTALDVSSGAATSRVGARGSFLYCAQDSTACGMVYID